MKKLILSLAHLALLGLTACGTQAFHDGSYDDVNRANLMTDTWSESDMQVVAQSMVNSMVAHPAIAAAKNPPLVIVTNLQNKTSEHIDTQSIMDMVRVEIMKSGKVAFIDKEAREDIKAEYDYQGAGNVSDAEKKGPGSQKSADFIVNGRLDSIVQEVGKNKTVYYKMTLNLTNLKTSVIVWTDQKEIRKAFRKKSVGL